MQDPGRPLVAFLGPSLPADVARAIAPDVELLPPVCRGDLAAAVERLRPRAVLIVDGEFADALAVRPKEILHALRAGSSGCWRRSPGSGCSPPRTAPGG